MKIKYTESDREKLFEDLLLRNYSLGDKSRELAAFRDYFKTGNIEKFIENGGSAIDPNSIFFVGANPTLENLKHRLQLFWDDLIIRPDKYKSSIHISKELPIESLFQKWANNCVSSFYNFFIPTELYAEVFIWIYGEEYEEEKLFPLSFGPNNWAPTVNCNSDWLATTLLAKASDYFFDVYDEYHEDPERVVSLLGYLCTTLPFTSKEIYYKDLFELRHQNLNGEYSGFSSKQSAIRIFIARANGILHEDQVENGIEEIIIRKPDQLVEFRREFENALPYPELYLDLVAFVKDAGEEYLWK